MNIAGQFPWPRVALNCFGHRFVDHIWCRLHRNLTVQVYCPSGHDHRYKEGYLDAD